MTYAATKPLDFQNALMRALQRSICFYYLIENEELFKNSRERHLMNARQVFQYLAHVKLKIPSPVVGHFSNRDHATVLHSKKIINDQLDIQNKEVRVDIANIMQIYKRPSKYGIAWFIIKKCIKDVFEVLTK